MKPDPEPGASWGAILSRALLYAAAVTLLVLFAPDEGFHFIYVGF